MKSTFATRLVKLWFVSCNFGDFRTTVVKSTRHKSLAKIVATNFFTYVLRASASDFEFTKRLLLKCWSILETTYKTTDKHFSWTFVFINILFQRPRTLDTTWKHHRQNFHTHFVEHFYFLKLFTICLSRFLQF